MTDETPQPKKVSSKQELTQIRKENRSLTTQLNRTRIQLKIAEDESARLADILVEKDRQLTQLSLHLENAVVTQDVTVLNRDLIDDAVAHQEIAAIVAEGITDAAWDEFYVRNVFATPFWRSVYWNELKSYADQYAPPDEIADKRQYNGLIRRVAALTTTVHYLETVKGAAETIDAVDRRLREYIAQLQRYTEVERHEWTLRTEVTKTVLVNVIGIAEMTIADPVIRRSFLQVLAKQATGKDLVISRGGS